MSLISLKDSDPLITKSKITNIDSSTKNFNRLETLKKVLKVASIVLFIAAIGTFSAFAIGNFIPILNISSDILLGSATLTLITSTMLTFSQRIISLFQKRFLKSDLSIKMGPSDISDEITPKKLIETLEAYNKQFQPIDTKKYIGKIEKIDLETDSKLILKADLHGDFTSLIKYLKTLQKQGYLDKDYRVVDKYKNKIVIAFLGDYIDRGDGSFKVLNLLMKLKMKNPNEIALLKGNHENIEISKRFINPNEKHFYDSKDLCNKLENFFSTLPLSVLVGSKDETNHYQYTCLTHGAIEPDIDMNEVLSKPEKRAEMLIEKNKKACLSNRITNILPSHLKDKNLLEIKNEISALENYIKSQSSSNLTNVKSTLLVNNIDKKKAKQILSALRVQGFLKSTFPVFINYFISVPQSINKRIENERQQDVSGFNWSDISTEKPLGPNQYRGVSLCLTPEFIKDYFRIISTSNRKIKALRAGHSHHHKKFSVNGKQGFIEILPVAGDLEAFDIIRKPVDFAQIITPAPKVKDWKKQTLKRQRGKDIAQISNEKTFYKPVKPSLASYLRSWLSF